MATVDCVCVVLSFPHASGLLSSPLDTPCTKVPEEFLRNCFERMRLVWENLIAFKEGKSSHEMAENMVGYQQQVVVLTRYLCLLKEYTAEVDECYIDERGFPPHGKYVCLLL